MLPLPALLFCPGDRPDRFEKALKAADGVILDLEDGVAPEGKETARRAVARAVGYLDPDRVIVRVNASGSRWQEEDLDGLARVGVRTVMLPKAASAQAVADLSPLRVIALCESAAGFLCAAAIADADNCVGLIWGAEDLIADLGGSASRAPDGTYLPVVQHARMELLLAAAACRVAPLDGVHLAVDGVGLAEEAVEAATMGFVGKAAIHPVQVEAIRAAFASSPERLRWARALLERAAAQPDRGVFSFEGQMVDEPLLEQARRVVAADQRPRQG